MQPLVKKDKERELKKKNAELKSKVENLEKKCAVLEVNKKILFSYKFLTIRAFQTPILYHMPWKIQWPTQSMRPIHGA